ncbi:MAG: hypothetical protein V3V01_09740 [Acidimicrobiales bacterium]
MPFFFDPHVNTTIRPLPSCVGDASPEFDELVFGNFLAKELAAGYDQHAKDVDA